MCEFISYVEKDGGVFYLTDREVFSAEGKRKLEGCAHNDVLGHGAIRAYWELTGGADKEVRGFWNIAALPPELAAKLSSPVEFDKYWGKMFQSGCFQNDDLCYIIEYAPDSWKAEAWEQLLAQKPTNGDLCYIIIYAPDPWKAEAAKQLLAQKPTNGDLCYIIECAPDSWKAEAWEQLLAQKPTNDDLCYIIEYAPDPWKAKTAALLR